MSEDNLPQIVRNYGGWAKDIFANSLVIDGPFRLVMFSGVGAEDEEDGHIHHPGDISGQSDLAFAKLGRQLAAVGATFENVVKMTAYVTDAAFREPYTQARLRALGEVRTPAHTFIVVSRLAWPEMLVEVDVTAVLPK